MLSLQKAGKSNLKANFHAIDLLCSELVIGQFNANVRNVKLYHP